MRQFKLWQSVVTRLITCLVIGGLVISVGLSVLEYQRSVTDLRLHLSQRIALTTRNLQSALAGMLEAPQRGDLRNTVMVFIAEQPIDAVRLVGPNFEPVIVGVWALDPSMAGSAAAQASEAAQTPPGAERIYEWNFTRYAMGSDGEIAFDRPTLVRAPFLHHDQWYQLELRINGPAARAQVQRQIIDRMMAQWLLLAVTLLLGLLLVRRWFTGPLTEVMELIRKRCGPEPFRRLGREHGGEFGRLADAMAGMLERVESTSAQLVQRERMFEELYEFAPTAMLSVDPRGRIIQANRRAAMLLGVDSAQALVGRAASRLVSENDRPRLQQAIDRLAADETTHCELRLEAEGASTSIDAAVEAVAVRDGNGALVAVRLALLDVSEWRRLCDRLEGQARLLNLVIDHMSDAILLVDEHHRVAAFNQKLADLVQRPARLLKAAAYEHESFWDAMGALDGPAFVERLRRMATESQGVVQERIETRKGVFQFQCMALRDATEAITGRLWVVRDATAQEHSEHLMRVQHQQLAALKQVSVALGRVEGVEGIDAVLECAATELRHHLGIEAVGLVVRECQSRSRCRQIIHRGPQAQLLEPNQALAWSMERELLPLVMHNEDVAFWPDVPHETPWGRALEGAGLTCIAAGPLRGPHETSGMVWIARRGGERLERSQVHLLETLLPTLAARLHILELEQRLGALGLNDVETALPTRLPFEQALRRAVARERRVAVLVLELAMVDPATARWRPLVVGNAAVRDVVERIQMACRRSTFIARLGADQLGLIVPDVHAAQVGELAERLRRATADQSVRPGRSRGGAKRPAEPQHEGAPRAGDDGALATVAGIGSACHPDEGAESTALYELAASRAAHDRGAAGGGVLTFDTASEEPGREAQRWFRINSG